MTKSLQQNSIAIVGAGIVGLSISLRLQMSGYRVTVFDRADPMQACSAGNAGYLSEANIFPPASPEMLRQLPRFLLSKSGPLVIRASYLTRMLPWTRRALSVLEPSAYRAITDTLASMTTRAYEDLAELAETAGASNLLSRDGGLVVFKSAAALEKKCRALDQWNGYGLSVRRLSGDEIRELEPALTPDIIGGLNFQNSGRCSNPQRLGLQYAESLHQQGVQVRRADVKRVNANASDVTVETNEGPFEFEHAIVCAGFWSSELLKPYVARIPIVSERGYHLMLPQAGVLLSRPVVFGEPHFAATPMDEGLRLAGTAEFASPNAPPDMRRATMLLKLAQSYLKPIDDTGAKPWMGVRPSLPDGLPAVGRVEGQPRLLYAFGHAHNGLTLSATTARCMEALLRDHAPPIDMRPLDIRRFGKAAKRFYPSSASSHLHKPHEATICASPSDIPRLWPPPYRR